MDCCLRVEGVALPVCHQQLELQVDEESQMMLVMAHPELQGLLEHLLTQKLVQLELMGRPELLGVEQLA
jgi:hypothetical protein